MSEYLGNTPAVCRSSYIDPRVIDLYDDGVTVASSLERLGAEADFGQPATHGMVEAAVLRLLRRAGQGLQPAPPRRAGEGRLTLSAQLGPQLDQHRVHPRAHRRVGQVGPDVRHHLPQRLRPSRHGGLRPWPLRLAPAPTG